MLHRKLLLTPFILAALCCAAPAAQAAISYVGSSTPPDFAAQVTTPAATQVGDFAVVVIANTFPISVTGGLDDWTVLRGGVTSDVLHILYRIERTGGATTHEFTFSGSSLARMAVAVFRGVDAAAPINALLFGPTLTNQTVATYPRPTTTADGCMLLYVAWLLPPGLGYATANDCGNLSGGSQFASNLMRMDRSPQATAGPAPICNLSSPSGAITMQLNSVALAPAPPGPPPPANPTRRRRAPVITARHQKPVPPAPLTGRRAAA